MARTLAPRNRWLTWGAFAGALYGAGYAWLACRLVGAEIETTVVTVLTALGGGAGGLFALRYYAARPSDTSLCTWLGMLVGTIPAVGMLILVLGASTSRMGIYALAAFAFIPVLVGLFIGGTLDRVSERFLFIGDPDEEHSP